MNSLYNIHWGDNLRMKYQKKKKGGNCFSPIITLVYRRTSRELVLGLFFKTFLFLNKQFAQSVRKDSNVWILGRISQEPRPGVFLGGKKKQKKGPAVPSVQSETLYYVY